MLLHDLQKKSLIHPPKWLADNTLFLGQMGSVAYGVSNDNSDIDVYGFCIPEKEMLFPHLSGEIFGFGKQIQRFEQWQEHHVKVTDWNQEYDFVVYNIVKYFQLCMENNPNMIDSLFIPRRCVLHSTAISEMIREKRHLFLHKGAWHKFKGYAYAQMHKTRGKTESANVKRDADIKSIGYSTKFAYHLVRNLGEVEQILIEHDLDLERNREQLKSIRRGEWTMEDIESYFASKEKDLETVYANSTLRHSPDERAIKQLLLDCLEHHYGDLSMMVARDVSTETIIRDMQAVIDRYREK